MTHANVKFELHAEAWLTATLLCDIMDYVCDNVHRLQQCKLTTQYECDLMK